MDWWNGYQELMTAQISNPLGDEVGSITQLFSIILDGLILLATPIIVLTVIYAGFLFVTAQGSVEKLGQAKRAITYALLGAVILLGAEAISELIKGSIDSLR